MCTETPVKHALKGKCSKNQCRTVAILVGCSPGSQPSQNCEGSLAVVVVAYDKPFEHEQIDSWS